jgi:hypothetical protein
MTMSLEFVFKEIEKKVLWNVNFKDPTKIGICNFEDPKNFS